MCLSRPLTLDVFGVNNCQGGNEAKASLVCNGRALSIFCREGPWGDDLHLFSGLIQGLTFSAKRLLKILKLSLYYFRHFPLLGSLSKILRTIFLRWSLALPLCPRGVTFF
jgi:hypothetical protein